MMDRQVFKFTLLSILLSSLLDVILFVLVFRYLWGTYFQEIFLFILALWVGLAIYGLWSFIKAWIIFYIFVKRVDVRLLVDTFKKQNLPIHKNCINIDEYLNTIIEDDTIPREVQIRAAILLGSLIERKAATNYLTPITKQQKIADTALRIYNNEPQR